MCFKDVSAPKQYLTLTHSMLFLAQGVFVGFADEEPMESQRGDCSESLARYIHCRDHQMTLNCTMEVKHQ